MRFGVFSMYRASAAFLRRDALLQRARFSSDYLIFQIIRR